MLINETTKSNIDICKEIMNSNMSDEAKIRAIQSMKEEDLKIAPREDYIWDRMKEDSKVLCEEN